MSLQTCNVQVYEDQQFLTPAPIGPQVFIPAGDHDIEFSWDRNRGLMRVIIEGEYYFFKEYGGKIVVTGTNNEKGRILMRGAAELDGEWLSLWRPDDAVAHPVVDGQVFPRARWRLCYRRSNRDWRLRNEDLPWNHPDSLHFVTGYVGDLNGNWFGDRVAHIFHHGTWIKDKDGLAHLYDPGIPS
jgi:hypothetical protein